MSLSQDGKIVVCGDSVGNLYQVDARTGKLVANYKGFVGSVKSVKYHPSLPFIGSVGLDRFLRVHQSSTRKLAHRLYIKQRMNCVLFSKQLEIETKEEIKEQKKTAKKKVMKVKKKVKKNFQPMSRKKMKVIATMIVIVIEIERVVVVVIVMIRKAKKIVNPRSENFKANSKQNKINKNFPNQIKKRAPSKGRRNKVLMVLKYCDSRPAINHSPRKLKVNQQKSLESRKQQFF